MISDLINLDIGNEPSTTDVADGCVAFLFALLPKESESLTSQISDVASVEATEI